MLPYWITVRNLRASLAKYTYKSVNNPFSLKPTPIALLSCYKVFKGLPTSELQLVRLGHSDMVAQSTLEIRKSTSQVHKHLSHKHLVLGPQPLPEHTLPFLKQS